MRFNEIILLLSKIAEPINVLAFFGNFWFRRPLSARLFGNPPQLRTKAEQASQPVQLHGGRGREHPHKRAGSSLVATSAGCVHAQRGAGRMLTLPLSPVRTERLRPDRATTKSEKSSRNCANFNVSKARDPRLFRMFSELRWTQPWLTRS